MDFISATDHRHWSIVISLSLPLPLLDQPLKEFVQVRQPLGSHRFGSCGEHARSDLAQFEEVLMVGTVRLPGCLLSTLQEFFRGWEIKRVLR